MSENFRHIAPTDIRDYSKSLGWFLLPEALRDGLYVLANPAYHIRQLVFPVNSDTPDYADAVEISLRKLAEISGRPLETVVAGVNEVKDDTLRLQIVDTRDEENFIPLSYAAEAINGA